MKRFLAIMVALVLTIGILPVTGLATEETIRVCVFVEGQQTLYAWAWGDYGNAYEMWPGKPMTNNGESWQIDVPAGTTGLVFSNGTNQTQDITVSGMEEVQLELSEDLSSYQFRQEEVIPPPEDENYYLTGCECFAGVEWDPGYEGNKLTKENGWYIITKENVPAGNHSIKITNGTWDKSWGGSGEYGNLDFELEEAGDVTVKFNPTTGAIALVMPGGPTGDVNMTGVYIVLAVAAAALVVLCAFRKRIGNLNKI